MCNNIFLISFSNFNFYCVLVSGLLSSVSITNDHSFVHWYKQGWRLLCTTKCIFRYLYGPNHHMGDNQHIRLEPNSIL